LYPGDVLFIPDLEQKYRTGATDTRHRFRLVRPNVMLRVKLLDKLGRPYKYRKYRVDVAGKQLFGHTISKGLVQERIPADATDGMLHLWLADEKAEHATTTMPLRIGYLDPVDEVTGVQARLNHLGFDCGAVDGIPGPKTASALAAFQKSAGLKETGEIDGPTR
jgi:N-acetylmuramoyl-L-alanine amidase